MTAIYKVHAFNNMSFGKLFQTELNRSLHVLLYLYQHGLMSKKTNLSPHFFFDLNSHARHPNITPIL